MTASKRTQWIVEKATDHTRIHNRCPVCGDRFGRTETVVDSDGLEGLKYWHTDLVETEEYCVEWCNGATQQVTDSTVNAEVDSA